MILKCKHCEKKLGDINSFNTYLNATKRYIGGKRIFFCSEKCCEEYTEQFAVASHINGGTIYCIDEKFLPYIDCNYYFDNIKDCAIRMGMKVGIYPF